MEAPMGLNEQTFMCREVRQNRGGLRTKNHRKIKPKANPSRAHKCNGTSEPRAV